MNTNKKMIFTKSTEMLRKMGFSTSQKGFHYIRTAIEIMTCEPDTFADRVIPLYEEVAKRHDTTQTRVERAIRHAIHSAFKKNPDEFSDLFPVAKKSPTCSDFLYTFADELLIILAND